MGDGDFGSEGVIPGAGGAGDRTEEWAMDAMKDPSSDKIVMFYGISSICVAVITLIWYLVFNYANTVRGLYWGFIIHQIIWWPAGIIWIALALWDSKYMRKIYEGAVMVTFLGPFAGYWIGLAMLLVHADDTDDWGSWSLWVAVPIWIGWTIFNMIMQVVMVPKIADWCDQPPKDNLPDEFLAQGMLDF